MKASSTTPSSKEVRDSELEPYLHPWWLKSPRLAPTIVADFGHRQIFEVSLDISMADRRQLTSNRTLAGEIHDFLCVQSLPLSGRVPRGWRTEREHFIRALTVLDYFLLNDTSQALARHGFSAVGAQELNQFLLDVASHRLTAEGIYGWTDRVSCFLLNEAASVAEGDVDCAEERAEIDVPEHEWKLRCSLEVLCKVRTYLRRERLYISADPRVSGYRLVPSSAELARRVFRNTLSGMRFPFPSIANTFPELCVTPTTRYRQELNRAPVWSGREDSRCGMGRFAAFKCKVLDFRRLSILGIGIPNDALDDVERTNIAGLTDLKEIDGVNPVPPPAVAAALKCAIDFFYENSNHLLTSLEKVLKASRSLGLAPFELEPSLFHSLLCPETIELGIHSWSLNRKLKQTLGVMPTAEQYLYALRTQRIGLWDLARILYGASLIVVGAMQAGRQMEVLTLRRDDLREAEAWLRVLTRKSGFDGVRYEDYRPAPRVTLDILCRLAEFLTQMGLPNQRLFSAPLLRGPMREMTASAGNACIDLFLDYVEGPCNASGKRYYLRQHQLRQFFAAAFFYSFGFAGLDTIRWFLRHLDPKQLWAYIEHTTPGSVLRHHKAAAVTAILREGTDDLGKLIALLRQRYKISSLELMSDEDLTELLEELQEAGNLEIQPVFAPSGVDDASVKLGVVVWE